MSYSADYGKTWTKCGGGVPLVPPVADRVNPNKFYAYVGGTGQMWVSADGGRIFNLSVTGLPPVTQSEDGSVSAVPGYEGQMLICCGSGGLYRSLNSGASATKLNSVTAAYHVGFGKAANGESYPAIYLYGIVNGALGFFRSDDAGVSWTLINDANHQYGWVHQISGDPRIYGRCYISAEGRGIAYGGPESSDTTDNPSSFGFYDAPSDSLRHFYQNISVSWSKASDPQGHSLMYVNHFFGPGVDTVFASTDTSATFSSGGIQPSSSYVLAGNVTNGFDTTASSNSLSFLTASLLTDVKKGDTDVPKVFALYQNYPNPFNPSTTVSYTLPQRCFVRLKVYDDLGQVVETLFSGEQNAGNYRVTVDAAKLASGVYLYRLDAGNMTITKKMMLLR
jgi:hypothetical protein